MSTLRRSITFALAAALGVGLGSARASAGSPEPGGRIERICGKIHCSEPQKTSLSQIFQELRNDLGPARESLRELRARLSVELRKAKPDEKAMQRVYGEMEGQNRAMVARAHRALMKVHALLEPEQRERLAALVERAGPRILLGGRGRPGGRGEPRHRPPPK
jgi:Spy/CpxP family protein refolding chaperone